MLKMSKILIYQFGLGKFLDSFVDINSLLNCYYLLSNIYCKLYVEDY